MKMNSEKWNKYKKKLIVRSKLSFAQVSLNTHRSDISIEELLAKDSCVRKRVLIISQYILFSQQCGGHFATFS